MNKEQLTVNVGRPNKKSLEETRKHNIKKAKAFYEGMPFVTKVYLAMKTNLRYEFISKNWEEITGSKDE